MSQEQIPEMEELPAKLDGNFFSFNSSDGWLTAAFVALAVIVWQRTNVLAALPVTAVWYALMVRRNPGRTYFLIAARLRSGWSVRVRKGNVWEQGDATVNNKAERKRSRKERNDDSIIPFLVSSVPSDIHGGSIGIMHHKSMHTDCFVVVAEGSRLAAQSLMSQHFAYDRFANMIKRLVGVQKGYSVGVSMLFRKDPFDSHELDVNLEEILHPEVIVPSGLTVPEEELTDEQLRWLLISQNWAELRYGVVPTSAKKVWMAIVVTMRRESVLAKAQSSGTLNRKYIGRLPINKMVKAVLSELEAFGATSPRALDVAEVNDFIRGGWDTVTIDEYYESVAADPEDRYRDGFRGHWPTKQMKVAHDHVCTDGTYATVVRVTATPGQVWQGYFRELYGSLEAPYFSAALVGEAVRSNREVWRLERTTAFLEELGNIVGINRKTLKAEAREERTRKRARDIFESAFSQSYSILVAFRGDSEEVLDDQVDQAEQEATRLGLSLERIELAELQYPALWSATLGLNML